MKFSSYQIANGTARRLKEIRLGLGLNQAEMAALLGLSQSGYYKCERGETVPGLPTLYQLKSKYNISFDWFLFGVGSKYTEHQSKIKAMEQNTETVKQQLTGEINRLKAQLQAETQRADEAEKRLETADERYEANLKPGVKDFLDYIDEVPVFYHEAMLFFQKYKANEMLQNIEAMRDSTKKETAGKKK